MRGAACLLLAALAGCADAPVARFHSLLAPPAGRAAAPAAGSTIAWTLAPVTVPAQVDRPQWVVRAPDDSLAVLENERWIAPLADELRAAVAERMSMTLGAEGRAPARGRIAWRATISVQRFDSVPARSARIDAAWTLGSADTAGAAATLTCVARFEQPAAAGYPALAAGHRQAAARLADALAAAIASLDRGEAADCPLP